MGVFYRQIITIAQSVHPNVPSYPYRPKWLPRPVSIVIWRGVEQLIYNKVPSRLHGEEEMSEKHKTYELWLWTYADPYRKIMIFFWSSQATCHTDSFIFSVCFPRNFYGNPLLVVCNWAICLQRCTPRIVGLHPIIKCSLVQWSIFNMAVQQPRRSSLEN